MKRVVFILVGSFFLISSITFAQTKVDPLLRILSRGSVTESSPLSKALSVSKNGTNLVSCFIKTEFPAVVAEKLELIGGHVGVTIGNIMTARIPVDRLDQIADWDEVEYLEGPKPLHLKMDQARSFTNVDDVQAGTGLSRAYDGTGVIVGVIDSTLDWGHTDFDDADGNTRIYSLWDQTISGDGVSEVENSSGVECTQTQINDGSCTATANGTGDSSSHGTHVTGIAAGSDSTYKGVAPGSNIIFVFDAAATASTDDITTAGALGTQVVEGATYIFKKAGALGKAAVINLSLGTSLGAHDDTSVFEAALNSLTDNKKGRAIVNAAGNEDFSTADPGITNFGGIHGAISVSSGADKAFEFAVRNGGNLATYFGREVIVDIWLSANSTCTIETDTWRDSNGTAKVTRTANMSAVSAGSSSINTDDSNVTTTFDFTDNNNAQNGKQHAVAVLNFGSSVSSSTMQTYSFDVIFRGSCTGDMWLYPDSTATVSFYTRNDGLNLGNGYTYVGGDSSKTTTIPGTASGVITAASYMGRGSWTDYQAITHNQTDDPTTTSTPGATGGIVNGISLFSSLGPTGDNRIKPDVAAPGEPILSTLATAYKNSMTTGRVGDISLKHFKLEGTSMASPHVAGTVALLFQKNKCLTTSDLKTALHNGAITDSFTGSVPNNTWGWGKLDALASIQLISEATSDCSSELQSEGNALKTPGTGSGGTGTGTTSTTTSCQLSPDSFRFSEIFFLFLLPFLWLLRRSVA